MLGPKIFRVGYRPLGQLPPEPSVVLGTDLWVRGTWSASFHPRRSLYWVQTRSVQLPADRGVRCIGYRHMSCMGYDTRSVQLPAEAFVVLGTDIAWAIILGASSFHPRRSLYWVQTYGSGLYTRSFHLRLSLYWVQTNYGFGAS